MSIPFEALDIHLGSRIDLDLSNIFQKVIDKRRGGYCYELNYLFNSLLSEIGYESHLISAKIYDDNKFGPEFDHLAIIVNLNGLWLLDVGFGDLFIHPLRLDVETEQEDTFKVYKIVESTKSDYLLTESLRGKSEFIVKYKFNLTPRIITDFEDQNNYKQDSKHSHFVKNRICTIATKTGRKTILNNTFKVRNGNTFVETEISNKEEFNTILENEFNIKIDGIIKNLT